MLGVSVLRNSRLANVFYRLHLIEAAVGLSQSTTIRVLNALAERQLVSKRGRGKNTAYAAVSR